MKTARIPVVLSQAAIAAPDARRLEEDLVAELMVQQGVDINVVPDLRQLRGGSTGLLCLQGIKSDWILLTWLDAESARQTLQQHGISGQDWLLGGLHDRDRNPAADGTLSRSAGRRLGILRLDVTKPPDWYVREIRRLRDAIEPTDLAASGLPIVDTSSQPAAIKRQSPEPEHPFVSSVDRNRDPSEDSRTKPAAPCDDLDRLLDQLDDFDA